MMKPLLSILILLTSCTSLFGYSDCCRDFGGFYAGVAGGIATQMAENRIATSADFTGVAAFETLTNDSRAHVYKLSPWGELFAGWGRQCSSWYWGGRFGINFSRFNPQLQTSFADIDPADDGSAFLDDSLKTRLWTTEYTFDFKPGWIFCSRSMLFGLIGVAINKERLEGTSTFRKELPVATAFNELKVEKEKTSAGWRVGFGLEHMISRCMSLQVSYVYSRYQRLSRSETILFADDAGSLRPHSVDFRTRASRQVSSIGLAYYF